MQNKQANKQQLFVIFKSKVTALLQSTLTGYSSHTWPAPSSPSILPLSLSAPVWCLLHKD